jgi:hypothetical protein
MTWLFQLTKAIIRTFDEVSLPIPLNSEQWIKMELPPVETFSHEGFPPGLRHMAHITNMTALGGGRDPSSFWGRWWAFLPSTTLMSLDMANFQISDAIAAEFPACAHLTNLNIRLFNPMPPFVTQAQNLRKLQLTFVHLPPKGAWKSLPRDIVELRLILDPQNQGGNGANAPHPLLGIPHQELKILYCNQFYRIPLGHSDLEKLAVFQKLESLDFDFPFDSTIQDDHLELLPRSLTRIHIIGETKLSGACLSRLPPSTTEVRFDVLTLLNQHLMDLPPSLRRLHVSDESDVDISLDVLPNLPRQFDAATIFKNIVPKTSDPLRDCLPDPRTVAGNPSPIFSQQIAKYEQNCLIS